MQYWNEVLVLL